MLKEFDLVPADHGWTNWLKVARARIVACNDTDLASELREPSTNRIELREATVREALARILERKP